MGNDGKNQRKIVMIEGEGRMKNEKKAQRLQLFDDVSQEKKSRNEVFVHKFVGFLL